MPGGTLNDSVRNSVAHMKSIYPNDADGDALRRVVASGSDMSRPMRVEFFVAVPDQYTGESVVRLASDIGYAAELVQDEADEEQGHSEASGAWTCYCSKSMILTYEGVIHAQQELDDLSRPLGGFSDGWGTPGNENSE
jgi:hypothetical protein